MIDLKQYWWPLATQAELDMRKPLARSLHDVPLVIFRDEAGKPAALLDRCPHRHAPLSAGRVHQGELECPYHGWRFDSEGCCTRVPGMESGTPRHLLHPVAVCEAHGLVWGCLSLNASTPAPVAPSLVGDHLDSFLMVDRATCTIAAAAENFLDGFHTHFVHAGWIRRDTKRQHVRVRVHRLDDGVEAQYSDESLQSGLISSLLERDRAESMGRFRVPGIAEIEYRGRDGLSLLITAWLTPETGGHLRIHARIATRKGYIPGWLKNVLLKHLFGVILRQDKSILDQTQANIMSFERSESPELQAEFLDSHLDLLGPFIRRLMNGEVLEEINKNIVVKL